MRNRFRECLVLKDFYNHVENDGSYWCGRIGEQLDIYFEKSNGKIDWKHNFYFPAKPYRDMKDKWFCHRGFLKVWKSIEPYLESAIKDADVTTINITGYSHGAAIAQLCYEYVKFNRPDVEVTGLGFGAPRIFWGFARKAVRARFKGFKVIRNGGDIVTYLPPVLFGFRHICDVECIGEKVGMVDDHRQNAYLEALKAEERKDN